MKDAIATPTEITVPDDRRSESTEVIFEADLERTGSKRDFDVMNANDDGEAESIRAPPGIRTPLAVRKDLGVYNTADAVGIGRAAKWKASASIHAQLTTGMQGLVDEPARQSTSLEIIPTTAEAPSNNPKVLLTRFIQKLTPEEDIFDAAQRSCMLYLNNHKNSSQTVNYQVSPFDFKLHSVPLGLTALDLSSSAILQSSVMQT